MRTRTPKAVSPEEVRSSAACPGSSVVTSTWNGAKSSETRAHTSWTRSRSALLKAGSPSREKGACVPAGRPPWSGSFHQVPPTYCPSKSRRIRREAPGRLCRAKVSASGATAVKALDAPARAVAVLSSARSSSA